MKDLIRVNHYCQRNDWFIPFDH